MVSFTPVRCARILLADILLVRDQQLCVKERQISSAKQSNDFTAFLPHPHALKRTIGIENAATTLLGLVGETRSAHLGLGINQ